MEARSHHQKLRTVFSDWEQGRRLLAHMWRHFKEDRCFAEAASLSYTSLLSLVPLLAVVFGIASAFPVFDQWSEQLQDFVYRNLVPDAGSQLAGNFAIDGIEVHGGALSRKIRPCAAWQASL